MALTKSFAATFTPYVPAQPYRPYSKICPPPPPTHTIPGLSTSTGWTQIQGECSSLTIGGPGGITVTVCVGDLGPYFT